MNYETRRLQDFLGESMEQALSGNLSETTKASVEELLRRIQNRGAIAPEVTIEIDPDADLDSCVKHGIVPLLFTGPADVMMRMMRKGRDALPFPVPDEIPADMDPKIVAHMDDLHAYYDENMTWGSLHIVLDDGNVSDDDVQFCIKHADKRGDATGGAIARMLGGVSPDQRLALHQWWYGLGQFSDCRSRRS